MHLIAIANNQSTRLKIVDEPTRDSWEIDGAALDKLTKKLAKVYIGGRFEKDGALYAIEPAAALAMIRDQLGDTSEEKAIKLGKAGWWNLIKCIFMAMAILGCVFVLVWYFIRGIILFFVVLCLAAAFAGRGRGF